MCSMVECLRGSEGRRGGIHECHPGQQVPHTDHTAAVKEKKYSTQINTCMYVHIAYICKQLTYYLYAICTCYAHSKILDEQY